MRELDKILRVAISRVLLWIEYCFEMKRDEKRMGTIPTKGGYEIFKTGSNPLIACRKSRLNFEHRQHED